MANKRMIASDIWRDDFVSSLDYFQRLLWIGMVVTCADDQGRLRDRAGFIASDVFPGEMLSPDDIESALKSFASEGKITRYAEGKTKLIQIVNWWAYQSPSWAVQSKYQPPEGWTDRVKMHTKDNKVVMVNWDVKGGYDDGTPPLPTVLPTDGEPAVPTGIEESERREEKSEEESERSSSSSNGDNSDFSLSASFTQISGLKLPTSEEEINEWSDVLIRMKREGVTPSVMRRACNELTDKKYRITSPKSIEKACYMVLAEKKRQSEAGYIPANSSSAFFQDIIR